MRQQYGNKVNLTLNIDFQIKAAFLDRYPGQASYLIEAFMRDMLGMDRLVIDPSQSEEEQLNKIIQEASSEQHKAALQIRAAEIRKKQLVENKLAEEKDRVINQRRIDEIAREETQAREMIRVAGDDIKFKLAQEQAQKEGRAVTAREFLATQ